MRAQASYTITAVKDGNDLDSILMLWKKTTTNAAPAKPSGTNLNGWSTDMPEFESGAYVWTCNRVAISDPTASTPIYTYTDPVLDTHWKKLDEVYKQGTEIKDLADKVVIRYYNSNGADTSFKLSDGALDLSFLKGQIDDAEKVATNFISLTGNGGVEVGNKSGGSWTGYRSQMLADSFNIVDENGALLAMYGANSIDLGMNEEDSVINFCGGAANISFSTKYDSVGINSNGFYVRSTGRNVALSVDTTIGGNQYNTDIDISGGRYGLSLGAMTTDVESLSITEHAGIMLYQGSVELISRYHSINLNAPNVSVSGKIRGNSINSYGYQGRKNALIATDNKPGNTTALYPIASMKTTSGDWSIGTIGEALNFVYTRDTNYSAGTNTTSKITFNPDGHLILPKSASYQVTFGDGSEAVAVIPYYESSGYKALRFGLPNGGYDTLMCGKDIQLRGDGALWFYPYYGKANNPNYWGICVGVTSTDIGPCLRPMSNDYCSIGANGIGFRYIYATHTGIQNTSDRRLKENISDDFSKLEKAFGMLHPVTYDYKHLENDDNMRIGFIAQEVWETLEVCGIDPYRFAAIHMEKVDPETDIAKFLDTDETYYLNYTEFTALNTYMIQKLMKRIEKLEKRIA